MPVDMTFIQFETRAVAVTEDGDRKWKDVDYAILTPMGGLDCVEREVTPDLLNQWENQGFPNRVAAYKAFKEGKEPPLDGYPIKEWPVLTPAEVKMCLDANIRTVEALASAPDAAIKRLSLSGVSLQNKAKTWLSEDKSRIVEQLSELKAKVEGMEAELERLYGENESLRERAGDPPRQSSRKSKAA